jgi:hypothetical protein
VTKGNRELKTWAILADADATESTLGVVLEKPIMYEGSQGRRKEVNDPQGTHTDFIFVTMCARL